MRVRPVIERIQKAVAEIPALNKGGCGIFAFTAGKALQSMGFNVIYPIFEYDSVKKKYTGNQEEIKVPVHVMVKVKKTVFDSNQIVVGDPVEWKEYPLLDFIDDNKLESLIQNRHHWNSAFDREKFAPEITRNIREVIESL